MSGGLETLTQRLGGDGLRFVTWFWVSTGIFHNVDFARIVVLCVLN